VFNFTTINIPVGVTVTFTRNATNTPVTMLASGNAVIAGTISLNGGTGGNSSSGTGIGPNGGMGGPGGFSGGDAADGVPTTTGGTGLGPGGGGGGFFDPLPFNTGGAGGSFSTAGGSGGHGLPVSGPTYGVNTLLPLIGGSGGGGGGGSFGFTAGGGGGGGGAILIASSGTITFTGSITSVGGKGGDAITNGSTTLTGAGGGGSGGAVRIIATTIAGSGGTISVAGGVTGSIFPGFPGNTGGNGGIGRIRIEAFTNTATINFAQAPSIAQPGPVALPGGLSLRIGSVAGVAAPTAPTGAYTTPDITLPAGTANPMTIDLAASNIPLGTTVTVTVKPQNGAASSATSTALAGTLAASTATASVTIPTNQPSVISASATFTLAALPGAGPVFAEGEEVEQVRVAAVLGGPSQVTYLTASGRELPAESLERR
jgi:hypothetical protein